MLKIGDGCMTNIFKEDLKFENEDDAHYYELCIHEAGHGVLGALLLWKIDKIDMFKEDFPTTFINVQEFAYRQYYFQWDYDTRLNFAKDHAVITLAGASATARLNNTTTHHELTYNGGGADLIDVEDIADGNLPDYRLDQYIKRTDKIVQNEDIWSAIKIVGLILYYASEISGDAIKNVLYNVSKSRITKLRGNFMSMPLWCKQHINWLDSDDWWYGEKHMDEIADTYDYYTFMREDDY